MSLTHLVISLTRRCNSRCLACEEWKTPKNTQKKELNLTQYQKIFRSWQGQIPYLSFVGGEAFLREDYAQIINQAADFFKPKMINLTTNGLLSKKIASDISNILEKSNKNTVIIANLSIDGIEKVHDQTRGGRGFFKKLITTYQALVELKKDHPNLKIFFHTGLSLFNKKNIPQLLKFLKKINLQGYILEPVTDRTELLKAGIKIQISAKEFKKIYSKNKATIRQLNQNVNWPIRLVRLGYYPFALKIMEKSSQIIPCQAISSSLSLDPYGYLSPCELKQPFANIIDFKYNLHRCLQSLAARKEVQKIKNNRCFCHTSYCYYNSIQKSPWYLLKWIFC